MKTRLILLALMLWSPAPVKLERTFKEPGPERERYTKVSVSMYTIEEKQTDSTPLLTASGFRVDSIKPKKHKIIAVSRDLKKKLGWGEKVRIEGIGKWDGVYRVEDLMHSRWKNKIDILINPEDKAVSFQEARLYEMK